MLDPGRYLAEAIYFLQYTVARLLWTVDRALLGIALLCDGVNGWLGENVGYFVQLVVNALSAPLGGMLILALTALGLWYALNTVTATERWVDPGQLLRYGLLTLLFFSAPVAAIEALEGVRGALSRGIDTALLDGAAGDYFTDGATGTDEGLPDGIADVNADGVLGSFDLVSAFVGVANLIELDNREFPALFEATYFPYGDPAGLTLSDEADQTLAKALAAEGIERLLLALAAIPTAIAEHSLRLVLTVVALLLYVGAPFAMLFAFFIGTQAFLGAYLRQFVSLLIETFLSLAIVTLLVGLLAAAARAGSGLYIAAGLVSVVVIGWRIVSALKLASAAFNLFGGSLLTGGAGGLELVNMGRRAALGGLGLAGAVATGGVLAAVGGAALAGAAATRRDAAGADEATAAAAEGRARQLSALGGYVLGRNEQARGVVEGVHAVRTLVRTVREGDGQTQTPDTLDYVRAGSSLAGLGGSPWLAMRLSPSLRAAYDELGGVGRAAPPDVDGAAPRSFPPAPATGVPSAATPPAVPVPTAGEPHATQITGAPPSSATPSAMILLTPTDAARSQLVGETLEALEDPTARAFRSARRALTTTVGSAATDRLQEAVQMHGAEATRGAVVALGERLEAARAAGLDGAAVLEACRSGALFAGLRQETGTPLDDRQLGAAADLLLLPQRAVTRVELAEVLGWAAAQPDATTETAAAWLETPAGLGGQTGPARGVLAGARALRLSAETLAELAGQLQDAAPTEELVRWTAEAGGAVAATAQRLRRSRELLADLAALPEVMVVPQTASRTTASRTTASRTTTSGTTTTTTASRTTASRTTAADPGPGAREADDEVLR